MITISNNGPELIGSNFWTNEPERQVNSFLSWNAGTARLLLPNSFVKFLGDMRAAMHVVISRGSMPDFGADSLEIMFDDQSETPFCIHLHRSHFDRLVPKSNTGPAYFTAWTAGGMERCLPSQHGIVLCKDFRTFRR